MSDRTFLGRGLEASSAEETLAEPLEELLEIRHLDVPPGDGGGGPGLDDLSFDVAWGETTAVVAEPGGGKTLLARALFGLTPVAGGEIRLDGADAVGLRGRDRQALLRRMQLVSPPEPMAMDPMWSVRQIVAEPLTALGVGRRRGVHRGVAEVMAECGVTPAQGNGLPGDLTPVQRQQVTLARALSMHPDLVVLDEPLEGLDLSGQTRLVERMTQLQVRMGVAFLLLTQDMAVARATSRLLVVLCGGRLVERGPTAAICGRPRHPFTRALVDALLPHKPGPWLDRERFRLAERPLPIVPRSAGCAFLERCPLADDICGARSPRMRELVPGHTVACHHAERIPDPDDPVSD